MNSPTSLQELVEALRCLPGVGPKSAQRMAFHLLERNRDGGGSSIEERNVRRAPVGSGGGDLVQPRHPHSFP